MDRLDEETIAFLKERVFQNDKVYLEHVVEKAAIDGPINENDKFAIFARLLYPDSF
jgi:hypothetical protein